MFGEDMNLDLNVFGVVSVRNLFLFMLFIGMSVMFVFGRKIVKGRMRVLKNVKD